MPNPRNTRTSICENCKLKENGFLCHLTPAAAKEFESIKFSSFYPAGSILFLENETARGIFLVCSGKVKLSVSSKGGKTLILQIARPGEIIGLSASMSGIPYEVTAETFIRHRSCSSAERISSASFTGSRRLTRQSSGS